MQNPTEAEYYSHLPYPAEAVKLPDAPTPNNPPWNVWSALGVWVLSVVLVVVVPNIFLFIYLFTSGISFADREQLEGFVKTDPTAVLVLLAPVLLVHVLTFAIAWVVVTQLKKYSFRRTLGWQWNGFRIWHGVAIFLGFYALAYLLTIIFGEVKTDFERMIRTSREAVFVVAFFATFTAPIAEEVVYRGLLFSAFQRKFGVVIAVILTTLLFTAVHIPQYSLESAPDYPTVSVLFLLSLVLTLLRAKTENLLPCVILHTIFNGLMSVVILLEPLFKEPEAQEPMAALVNFLFK